MSVKSTAQAAAILTAYAELEAATEAYYEAIDKFKAVYKPQTVNLDELCENINCVLVEVDSELDDVI